MNVATTITLIYIVKNNLYKSLITFKVENSKREVTQNNLLGMNTRCLTNVQINSR